VLLTQVQLELVTSLLLVKVFSRAVAAVGPDAVLLARKLSCQLERFAIRIKLQAAVGGWIPQELWPHLL
jgi:hypothetical protein